MKPPFQPSRFAQTVATSTTPADTDVTGAPRTGEWQVRLCNLSSTDGEIIYVRVGGTVTTSNGIAINPGHTEVFTVNGTPTLGFVSATGTPSVNIAVGSGY